jgi:hypothetical protein
MSAAEFSAIRARHGLRIIGRAPKSAAPLAPARKKASPAKRTAAAPTGRIQPGTRVMALDLSLSKTGMAWGQLGEKPEGTWTVTEDAATKKLPEAERLRWHTAQILSVIKSAECEAVIFNEFYNAKFMLAFRTNASLRGAVMASLAGLGIPVYPVAEITARKAAGVDTSKRREGERDGFMKGRAKARLLELGLLGLKEDEGDAALLLLGTSLER